MATIATFEIQRDRYASSVAASGLGADVERQAQLRAELKKVQATQAALHAQLKSFQAAQDKEIADQDFRFAGTHFDEQKIDILLQGFHAIAGVFSNISYTSTVVMGFASMIFAVQQVDNARRSIKYTFWTLTLLTIKMHVQCVYVATLAITDSTKLCFQGTKGQDDVRRAFHGLMAQRSEVFWNFMSGFISFIILYIFLVWVKMEQDTLERPVPEEFYIYGGVLSFLGWFVPVIRMMRSYRSTRIQFRIDYMPARGRSITAAVRPSQSSSSDSDTGTAESVHFVSDLALAVGPQSVRKRYEAKHRHLGQVLQTVSLQGSPRGRPSSDQGSPQGGHPAAGPTLAQAAQGHRKAVAAQAERARPNPLGGPEERAAYFAELGPDDQRKVLALCGRSWRTGGDARPGEHPTETFANLPEALQQRGLRLFAAQRASQGRGWGPSPRGGASAMRARGFSAPPAAQRQRSTASSSSTASLAYSADSSR